MRVFDREAVVALLRSEDPLQKTLPVAFDHAADAFDLDQIATEAEQNSAGGKLEVHRKIGRAGYREGGKRNIEGAGPVFRFPALSLFRFSVVHPRLHLTDGLLDAGEKRAAQDAVADVHFAHVRQQADFRDVDKAHGVTFLQPFRS